MQRQILKGGTMDKVKKFWSWKTQKIKNETTGEESTERVLVLNGVIAESGWFDDEVTPEMFKEDLMSGSGPITLWINSPGGDCVAAAQIYNMLMDYKFDVTVKIDGLAASAASVIAMAGTKVIMSPVSMLMIHNPSTLAIGDTDEMQKVIEMLDAVKDSIMNAYEIKTGLDRKLISKLMDNQTWMDAKKAKELHFCDEILEKEGANNLISDVAPILFEKNIAEKNLQNKLIDKYLIKKPEPKVVQNEGLSLSVINERLDAIEKFI